MKKGSLMGLFEMIRMKTTARQYDLGQLRDDILELRHRATDAERDIGRRILTTKQLQRENDELRLYVTVLYRLLIMKNIVSRTEINKLMEDIDMEDGVKDGRLSTQKPAARKTLA
jgi:hypothetical protein